MLTGIEPVIETAAACCACGSARHNVLGHFDHWGQRLGSVQCRRCGLIRVSPRLTPDAIAAVFTVDYFKAANAETWAARRIPIFRDVWQQLRRLGVTSVYDVGAVRGEFMAFLYAHGLRVGGCDVSESATSSASLPVEHGRLSELRPAGYDAVTILDTLYYCADPLAELHAARDAAPYLVLRLRTNRHAAKRARTNRWPAAGEHLWAFTPKTTRLLVERAGYRVLRVTPAAYSAHRYTRLANHCLGVAQDCRLPPITMSFMLVAYKNAPP